jgi:hypothetical protein
MRTTLTLDPDVAERLKAEMRHTGKGLKAAVNDALRHGLGLVHKSVPQKPFRVEPHDFGVTPGIDLNRMNQLVDELEAEEAARKLRR